MTAVRLDPGETRSMIRTGPVIAGASLRWRPICKIEEGRGRFGVGSSGKIVFATRKEGCHGDLGRHLDGAGGGSYPNPPPSSGRMGKPACVNDAAVNCL